MGFTPGLAWHPMIVCILNMPDVQETIATRLAMDVMGLMQSASTMLV